MTADTAPPPAMPWTEEADPAERPELLTELGRLPLLPLLEALASALAARRVSLERQGDWVLLASELVLLRSRPPPPRRAGGAAEAAARQRLERRGALPPARAAADWLAARPQLGQAVWGRGAPPREAAAESPAERQLAFWEALLAVLEPRPAEVMPDAGPPAAPPVRRASRALARLRRRMAGAPVPCLLQDALPPLGEGAGARSVRLALADTFLAGLELGREGVLRLEQSTPFGPILLHPAG
ncbi:hypothetical protein [Roseomonas sp. KE0001]|uniref:hypothetical protein n=1 Tax=Roseomonas sp. KE0001 TaxID=2479201 RepID=UPI0018DF2E9A|nr:hypothetical protein [Roseomonas sp. KE0001]